MFDSCNLWRSLAWSNSKREKLGCMWSKTSTCSSCVQGHVSLWSKHLIKNRRWTQQIVSRKIMRSE